MDQVPVCSVQVPASRAHQPPPARRVEPSQVFSSSSLVNPVGRLVPLAPTEMPRPTCAGRVRPRVGRARAPATHSARPV